MWLSHCVLDPLYAVCSVGKTKKTQNNNEAKESTNDAENPHQKGLKNLTSNLEF